MNRIKRYALCCAWLLLLHVVFGRFLLHVLHLYTVCPQGCVIFHCMNKPHVVYLQNRQTLGYMATEANNKDYGARIPKVQGQR